MTALADRYDCFLLDLDGVLYRADDPIAGAGDVTTWVREQGKRLAFVTNNSSKTPQQVADKLDRMGDPGLAGRGGDLGSRHGFAAVLVGRQVRLRHPRDRHPLGPGGSGRRGPR